MGTEVAAGGGTAVAPASTAPAGDLPAEGRDPWFESGLRPESVTNPDRYSFHDLPRFNAVDRPYIDAWATFAASHGLTQAEFKDAAVWALGTPLDKATKENFVDFALERGWREAEIKAALAFADAQFASGAATAGLGGGAAQREARLGEIRELMRRDSRAYFKDEAIQAEYRALIAQKG